MTSCEIRFVLFGLGALALFLGFGCGLVAGVLTDPERKLRKQEVKRMLGRIGK